jgi:hypothetical protein
MEWFGLTHCSLLRIGAPGPMTVRPFCCSACVGDPRLHSKPNCTTSRHRRKALGCKALWQKSSDCSGKPARGLHNKVPSKCRRFAATDPEGKRFELWEPR